MTTPTNSRLRSAVFVLALVASASPGRADDGGVLDGYLARIKQALEEAAAARAPVPPEPVPVRWRAAKLGEIQLASPLLALEAADLDGDGRDELIGLTTTEVALLEPADGGVSLGTRAPLPATPALVRSRDPVGVLAIDGAAILARSSEQGAGARYRLVGGRLEVTGDPIAGFPLCGSLSAELARGRNYFDEKTARSGGEPAAVELDGPFYAAECGRHISADGTPIETVTVADTRRVVRVACSKPDGACPPDALGASEVAASGYAFEVADVDRDGRVEVITSRGQAPGRKDRVRAFSHGGGKPRRVFDHRFDGGVVALAAPDLDGDGAREVIAAVRAWRSKRINLWVLTRPR